jgi:hypothetical protein
MRTKFLRLLTVIAGEGDFCQGSGVIFIGLGMICISKMPLQVLKRPLLPGRPQTLKINCAKKMIL